MEENYQVAEATAQDPESVAMSALERYTGSQACDFMPYILLTNFGKYTNKFAEKSGQPRIEGTAMNCVHWPEANVSIINFGVGSPMAALIIDLLSFLKPRAVLMLGLCGGLKGTYRVGDFFNPVAAIRDEGTSDCYLPARVPSLSSFDIQRFVAEKLETMRLVYHSGVIHTTNVRFWEFNEQFKQSLKAERCQAIDMECATLFSVGFARHVPVGALMLISDIPLKQGGVKTKESARELFDAYTDLHIETGIEIIREMRVEFLEPKLYQ